MDHEKLWGGRKDLESSSVRVGGQEPQVIENIEKMVAIVRADGLRLLLEKFPRRADRIDHRYLAIATARLDRPFSVSVDIPLATQGQIASSSLMVRDHSLGVYVEPMRLTRLSDTELLFSRNRNKIRSSVEEDTKTDIQINTILQNLKRFWESSEVVVELVEVFPNAKYGTEGRKRFEQIARNTVDLASGMGSLGRLGEEAFDQELLTPFLNALKSLLGDGLFMRQKRDRVNIRLKEGEDILEIAFGLPEIPDVQRLFTKMASKDGKTIINFHSRQGQPPEVHGVDLTLNSKWKKYVCINSGIPGKATVDLFQREREIGLRVECTGDALVFCPNGLFDETKRVIIKGSSVVWIGNKRGDICQDICQGRARVVEKFNREGLGRGEISVQNFDGRLVQVIFHYTNESDDTLCRIGITATLEDFERRSMLKRALFTSRELRDLVTIEDHL